MAKISHLFLADDPRLKTRIGHRALNSIRIATLNGGCALYGPYLSLPAGSYEAVIRFDPETPYHGDAMMDVCTEVGKVALAR